MPNFYDEKEIFTKVLKLYSTGQIFRDKIRPKSLFPLEIKFKSLKQSIIIEHYNSVQKALLRLKKEQFTLNYKTYKFKNIGTQNLPVAVSFTSREILLKYLQKEDEFKYLCTQYEHIIIGYSKLETLFFTKPFLLLEYASVWENIFLVLDFFLDNPKPMIYIRELSIAGIDTKFIEQYKGILDRLLVEILDPQNINSNITTLSHYGFEKKYFLKYPLPMLRFRILDESQNIQGLSDISLTIEAFRNLKLSAKNIYIVENKMTMLSFPLLEDSLVIFGSGYGVEILKNISWMQDKNLYYWGDIDCDGFAILSQIRGYFPHIKSIFMDEETIRTFDHYHTEDTMRKGSQKSLIHLSREEQQVYQNLHNNIYANAFRLEQEKIDFNYVLKGLKGIIYNLT